MVHPLIQAAVTGDDKQYLELLNKNGNNQRMIQMSLLLSSSDAILKAGLTTKLESSIIVQLLMKCIREVRLDGVKLIIEKNGLHQADILLALTYFLKEWKEGLGYYSQKMEIHLRIFLLLLGYANKETMEMVQKQCCRETELYTMVKTIYQLRYL